MEKNRGYLGISVVIFIFSIVSSFYAKSCSWNSYIDVPTADISNGLFVNVNGGYSFSGGDEQNFDINGSIEYGMADFIAGIKIYNESIFCLDLAYQIAEESGGFPSIAIGLENITNNKYISPLGDSGMVDEVYVSRPPEIASAYLAVTKAFSDNFEMSFGLGRGRFVGYGPKTKYLNFDAFSDEKHGDFMVGFFGGLKFSTPIGISFLAEVDGRDANVGFGYEAGIWKGGLSLDKIEHFFTSSDRDINAPWLNLSMSVNPVGGRGRETQSFGVLKIVLKDESSGRSIPGKIIVSRNNVERTFDVGIGQKKVLKLKPGMYEIIVLSPGYKMKKANLPVKRGSKKEYTIGLDKVISPAVKKSMDLTKEAAANYKSGKFIEAKEKLEEAVTLYPNNTKAQQGLEMVNAALAENLRSLKNKARVRESSGDIKGAINLWEQVLRLENTSTTRRHIQDLRDRLSAASRRRRPASRSTTTTTARKAPVRRKSSLSKQQIDDFYTKGLSAYFDGNYKEAIKYFQQVLSADPSHAQAKRYLGEAKKH